MSDDRVAVVLLVLAVGCLVLIAVGLVGAAVWLWDGPEPWRGRDDGW